MTTYTDKEKSSHGGEPIEGYKFTGTFTTYRYTNTELQVTINGEDYTPIAIKRSGIKAGTQEDDNLQVTIEMPYNCQLAADYGYVKSPPDLLLEIYRYHEGTNPVSDWALVWVGPVAGFSVEGRKAQCRIPSIFSFALSREVPSVYYQNPCQHVLYDSRCKVNSASFKQSTTIITVGDQEITVADDGFADSYLKGGEIHNTTTGERRLIADNVSNVLTIAFDFFNASIGDTVDLYAGCDHSFSTCGSKFSNKENYGGQPYTPKDNPFQGEL